MTKATNPALGYLAALTKAAPLLSRTNGWIEAAEGIAQFLLEERPALAVGFWLADPSDHTPRLVASAGPLDCLQSVPVSLDLPASDLMCDGLPPGCAAAGAVEVGRHPVLADDMKGMIAIVSATRSHKLMPILDGMVAAMFAGLAGALERAEDTVNSAESERWQFYQALLSAPVACAVVEVPSLNFEFVNQRFAEQTRPFLSNPQLSGAGQLAGRSIKKLFSPDFASFHEGLVKKVAVSGEPLVKSSEPVAHPAGGIRHWDYALQPIRGAGGAVDRVLFQSLDRTETVQSKERAVAVQDHYERLVQEIHGVIWQADWGADRFTFVSQAAESITGHPPSAFYQPGFWRQAVHPDDVEATLERRERLPLSEDRFVSDYRLVKPDGSVAWIHDLVQVIRDKRGAPQRLRGLMIDNTDIIGAQLERDRMQDKLLQVQKLESLGVLAGGIAHDFNNLLTGVLGNASLVQTELGDDHPARSRVDSIVRAANRAAELTRQLLAYSGKGRFVVTTLDLADHIREILELVKASLHKKAVLALDLDDELPPIEADSAQLQQVVMNLVINGAEALERGSGTVKVSTGQLTIYEDQPENLVGDTPLAPGDYVYLEVRDDGCGMSPETKRQLFDPFFTTKPAGRGLGMAAVQGIVHSHNAGLSIASALGEGTTFRVFFPAGQEPIRRDPSVPIGPPLAGGLMLLVDDEEQVRNTAAAMLEHLGFGVITAVNGKQGLALFEEFSGELTGLMLDLTMPDLDGSEVLRHIRERRPHLQVIVSSGYDRRDQTVGITFDDRTTFLQKPYTLKQLVRALPR